MIDHYEAEVTSANDYYPFGMLMPGRKWSSGSYRYGFNGKENDNEVRGEGNQQDYGMRIYDPRLGRFLSVDPLQDDFPFYSPYQFSSNNPIVSTDIDGLEASKILNQVENFFEGFLDGFVFDDRNTPTGESGGTTDIHGGKNFKNAPIEQKNLQRFKEDPLRKITEDFNDSWEDTKSEAKKLKSGDAYSWGSLFGKLSNIVIEGIVVHQGTPTSKGVIKTRTAAGQQKKATSVSKNNNVSVEEPPDAITSNSKPTEAYNRKKHYGYTPTKADRKALGAKSGEVVDHTRSLVEHYYEGDGKGGKPGHQMTKVEREEFAKDRSRMRLQKKSDSDRQGAEKSRYSQAKKQQYGL